MARTSDNRSTEAVAKADAELALPDPLEPKAPPTLEELLPEPALCVVERFKDQWLPSVLRGPVNVPDPCALRPMIEACKEGMAADHWDPSPAWRSYFGSQDEAAQGYIRSIWSSVRAHRQPDPERYALLVDLLARSIIVAFKEAESRHRKSEAKREAERGPVARAQAAAQLLELLPAFQTALVSFIEVTRDAAGSPFASIAQGLPHIEHAAKGQLA